MPEFDEGGRIGELSGDGDDLVLTELRERFDAELRAFVELLDQPPSIRNAVEPAAGPLERRSQLVVMSDHRNAGTSGAGHRLDHTREPVFIDERAQRVQIS